jgi:hypothetical protein
MAFDPSLPPDEGRVLSTMLRGQFNALNDRIDAVPGVTGAVVDSVTTVGPGQPASVTFSVIGTVLHVSLALPEGQPGLPGAPGLQGPPFANVVIDSITTLDPGANAAVWMWFDGTLVHLSFGIPRGMQGEQGIQGPPGEVTSVMMGGAIATAIAGTSNNTNSVLTMDTPFTSDPLSLADGELIRAKINELILAQRR